MIAAFEYSLYVVKEQVAAQIRLCHISQFFYFAGFFLTT